MNRRLFVKTLAAVCASAAILPKAVMADRKDIHEAYAAGQRVFTNESLIAHKTIDLEEYHDIFIHNCDIVGKYGVTLVYVPSAGTRGGTLMNSYLRHSS